MKFHWGHGVFVALTIFIIFILSMIFFFPMGKQNSELITENYYEEELVYQDVIDAKNRTDKLAEKPHVELKKEGIFIMFPKEINNSNAKFNFYLYRTEDQNLDIKKDFQLMPDNTFTIPAKVLVKGSYTLKLKWHKDNLNYQRDYDIQWK
ncbi:FixH family protein [Weeksellaceae bacterium A-14]